MADKAKSPSSRIHLAAVTCQLPLRCGQEETPAPPDFTIYDGGAVGGAVVVADEVAGR